MDGQPTAADAVVEVKKKEESEEPEKKLVPDFSMFSIGTNEEPVSLLSEDEDEETREIMAMSARLRDLKRKRHVRLVQARGVQVEIIE